MLRLQTHACTQEARTHDVVGHVVLELHIMGAVNSHCTVPCLADCASPHVLLVLSITVHVPMQGVPAQLEGLSCLAHLDLQGQHSVNVQRSTSTVMGA